MLGLFSLEVRRYLSALADKLLYVILLEVDATITSLYDYGFINYAIFGKLKLSRTLIYMQPSQNV